MTTRTTWSSSCRGRWLNILAVLAVLLHASVLASHRAPASMSDAQQDAQQARFLADLGIICSPTIAHGKASTDRSPDPNPETPPPHCPACTGAATSPAVLPSIAIAYAAIHLTVPYERAPPALAVAVFDPAWPRGRGPPDVG